MQRVAWSIRSLVLGPYSSGDKALARLFGGAPTLSGVSVTEDTAMNIPTVLRCVAYLSGQVGMLPLKLYRRTSAGREEFTDHPVYDILSAVPNPIMSSFTFRQTLQQHALLWGNGYAEIQFDNANRPRNLFPIEPWRVEPKIAPSGMSVTYRVTNPNGTDTILQSEEVLHIKNLGEDGVVGRSTIRRMRESLGFTVATDRFGQSFFGNGASFGGVFVHPNRLSDKARDNLTDSINSRHQGVERAHRFLILEEGFRYERLGIPPEDAQFLETRQFQGLEICRMFGVPPHKVYDLTRATFSNIEHQSIETVTDSLMPWLVNWEQELDRKLIKPLERKIQFTKFTTNALMRGDATTRATFYAQGRNWGYFSANDIRALEDLNNIGTEGDLYLIPANMTPANRIDEIIDKQVAPEPKPVVAAPASSNGNNGGGDRALIEAFREEVVKADQRIHERFTAQTEHINEAWREIKDHENQTIASRDAVLAKLEEVAAANAARLEAMDHRQELGEISAGILRMHEGAMKVHEVNHADVMRAMEALPKPEEGILARLDALPPPPAPPDMTPLVEEQKTLRETIESLRAENRARTERIAALIPDLGEVIESAVRTVVKFETDRAVRAAQGGPEKLAAWIESFYAGREDAAVQHLLPTMRLRWQLTGRADSAEEETRRLIRGHIDESRASLAVVLADPENLEVNVKALAAHWEASRPKAVAAACVREVIADG